ncbi:C40 family peptidase [Nonomuraea jiangxiensis]|uniref:NlpC/P60 family protein n=1 Tax=Nonomuraea jiangxiensis TaxID=633440 RepID=A0A1G9T1D1_9ACTN|nr:C40 family peptidase [Nonomuraea jiangxiensis]SDM41452.1 NlpC/P60 family protein [Nonomuraea jiangxiensis]
MNGLRRLLPIALVLAIHGTHSAPALARSAGGAIAVRAAIEMIGVPYSWGGGGRKGPGFGTGRGAGIRGFDCSGLTEYAWARAGVLIGSTTYAQWRSGIRLAKEEVEPGDLVFYDNDPSRPGPEHVGLAVDATRIVHAPYTGQVVRLDPLDRRTFLGVVRPSAAGANVEAAGAVTIAGRPDEPGLSESVHGPVP